MQLRDDFAKHISELNNPIDRPYTTSIDKSLLESTEDIEHLNKEIHDVNREFPKNCVTAYNPITGE